VARTAPDISGQPIAPSDERVSLVPRTLGPILILAFVNLCSFADRQLTSILAKPISDSLHIDSTHMALLGGTAFVLLYGVAGVPAGLAADRFPRRLLICSAVVAWSASTLACGLSSNFTTLFFGRVGVGLGEAILLPCAFSLIKDLVHPTRQGLAFAIFGLGIPAGAGLGLIAGGVLNSHFASHSTDFGFFGALAAWQKTFAILACLGLPAALLSLLLPEPKRARVQPSAAGSSGAGPLAIAAFLLATAGGGMMIQGVGFWLPSILMDRFSMTTGQIGLRLGSTAMAASICGMFVAGSIADALVRRRGTAGSAAALAAAFLSVAPMVFLLETLTGGPVWIAAAGFAFFASGFTPVASGLAIRLGPAGHAGLMGALFGLVVNLAGNGLGPLLYGWLSQRPGAHFPQMMIWTTSALAGFSAFCAISIILLVRGKAERIS
jgi:MFS family permease